jgi:hypothetical protein
MLTPHSTDVSGSQLLDWLESLLLDLNLDLAQEFGIRMAISELREFTEGPGMDAALEAQAETTRAECENEHADAIKALEKEHADALDDARAEAHEAGYDLGVIDAESAIMHMLPSSGWSELLESYAGDLDFEDLVYDAKSRREIAEAHAERERVARLERQQLDREQAERDRLAAVRKRGAPRKPRTKKAAAK